MIVLIQPNYFLTNNANSNIGHLITVLIPVAGARIHLPAK